MNVKDLDVLPDEEQLEGAFHTPKPSFGTCSTKMEPNENGALSGTAAAPEVTKAQLMQPKTLFPQKERS